ncbi:hypothetical protein EXIGLDRAFT_607459 [Exidia glandulosa HHB12029]|uniref:Eukaryotic translation initiation factor 3 subunit L n=1 Tax=Exidia glandulosa HHB12029 TaxID=1314781 RepID=A0A165LMD9_EXIGL|nr:hypothetical protein EXIGLDRAFT_607459 [Exidia glandulosa HHB12029]
MSRVQLWAADQEDEDLADVDLGLAIGSYGQHELQPRFDEAAFVALQHQMQQQAAFAQIPDVVKRFLVSFHRAVRENNVAEISAAYEGGWNKLTEKYYAKTEWPDPDVVAPLVNDDPLFLILYRELYYRHVYSRLTPDVDDRFHSYENSCELFNFLLNSDGPVPLELPDQWLWDIIDEFIYQFQSFCLWRQKSKSKEPELEEDPALAQTWSTYSVLNVLYSFVQKSRINEYLDAVREGKSAEEIADIVGEYGSKPLYRMLGYFSLIGLLRVHVLLGDYTLAMKVVEHVELGQKAMLTRVTACHVATYYYVGFCYFVLRRYADATRTFASVLNFIGRMRQYHTRSYQYDQINKTADRMYALFALCTALSPSRLDDNVLSGAKERFNDQTARMARGDQSAYEELYSYACPKFISPDGGVGMWGLPLARWILTGADSPHPLLQALFREELKGQKGAGTLRGFLKMYKTVDVRKMAAFLEGEFKGADEVVMEMMVLKQASRSISHMPGESAGSLLDGQSVSTSDLDFVIDENIVHVAESTIGRRYAGWFIRNAEGAERAYDGLRNAALPKNLKELQQAAAAAAAAAGQPQQEKKAVSFAKVGA